MSSISTGLWFGVQGSFRASVSRTCLRRRPHRLPLQMPSSTMAPTSALVAVSEGTAVSFLEPLSSCQPMIIRVRGAQSGNQDVHPERELRSPADDWGLTAVICGTTQSPRGKYVLDGARG